MLSQSDLLNPCLLPELANGTSARKRLKKWQCNLSEMLVGDYLIIPLTSATMLKTEGYRMNICCRHYAGQCANQTYCVFSIRRRTGERLATLGLKYDNGYWQFDQCVGPSNSDVLEEKLEYFDEEGELQVEWYATDLYYVAQEVGRLMNSTGGHYKN